MSYQLCIYDVQGSLALTPAPCHPIYRFEWHHTSVILGESLATITWTIPPSTDTGDYRIQHFGYHKHFLGSVSPYSGTSSTFSVK